MLTLCAVFGCVNKSADKSLSFFRFPKVKSNVCSDLKAKMLAQRMAWLKSVFLNLFDITEHQPIIFFSCGTSLKIIFKKKGTQNMAINGNISNALKY